jgi:hypothetical protein
VRHQTYVSEALHVLAHALLLQNWVDGLAAFAGLLPMYLVTQ